MLQWKINNPLIAFSYIWSNPPYLVFFRKRRWPDKQRKFLSTRFYKACATVQQIYQYFAFYSRIRFLMTSVKLISCDAATYKDKICKATAKFSRDVDAEPWTLNNPFVLSEDCQCIPVGMFLSIIFQLTRK